MKKTLMAVAALTACITVFAQTPQQSDLNNAISNSKKNESPAALPKSPYSPDKMPPWIVNESGDAFQLITVTKDVSSVSGPEMFAADETAIFPGAVVFADQNLADGRPSLVGLPAGTADIFVEFNTGNPTPSQQITLTKKEVSNYIWKVLNDADGAYAAPVNYNAKTHYCSSTSELCYSLGIDAKYLQNRVKIDTRTTNKETKIVVTQDFTQKFYTVSITPHDITELYKYFGPNTTADMFKDRVGNRAIAVINSVTYGRRAYYFESYKTEDMTFEGSQRLKLNAGAASVDSYGSEKIAKSSKTDDVFMFMLGGSTAPAQALLEGKTVREAFAQEGALKINASNQGIPISYTAIFIASLNQVSAKPTGKYSETSYVKCPKFVNWEIKNTAPEAWKDCVKFRANYNAVVVTGNAQEGYKGTFLKGKGTSPEGRYIDYIENKYSWGETIKRTMPTKDITDNKVNGEKVSMDKCYIYGPVYYTIRYKKVAGGDWSGSDEGYFDASGGKMYVEIGGDARAGSSKKPYVVVHNSKPSPLQK